MCDRDISAEVAQDNASDVIEAARDIVALWKNPKIAALPRADRNAAIEDTRKKLIEAVEKLDVH